jgi:hypothetical protein
VDFGLGVEVDMGVSVIAKIEVTEGLVVDVIIGVIAGTIGGKTLIF